MKVDSVNIQERISRAVAGAMEAEGIRVPESFIFYRSFLDAISDDYPANVQLCLFRAIANYGLNAVEPSFDGLDGMERSVAISLWTSFRPQIQANLRRWYNKVNALANGADRGGAPHGNKNAVNKSKTSLKQDENKSNKNVKENVKENEKENVKEENILFPDATGTMPVTQKRKRRTFLPPAKEDVIKFFVDKGRPANEGEVYFGKRAGVEWYGAGHVRIWDWKEDAAAWIAKSETWDSRRSKSSPSPLAIPPAGPDDYADSLSES